MSAKDIYEDFFLIPLIQQLILENQVKLLIFHPIRIIAFAY